MLWCSSKHIPLPALGSVPEIVPRMSQLTVHRVIPPWYLWRQDTKGLSTHGFKTLLQRNRSSDIYAFMMREITATNAFLFLTDKRHTFHCWWYSKEFSTSYSHSFFPVSKHIPNPAQGPFSSSFILSFMLLSLDSDLVEWQHRGLFLAGWPSLLTGDPWKHNQPICAFYYKIKV